MFNWLVQNIGTIVIGLIVAGVLAAVVVKISRDRRKGKRAGCGCGCSNCPGAGGCDTI